MPRFEIVGPDGHRYEVTAPEGATEAEVLERVKAEAAKTAPPKLETLPPAAPKPLELTKEDRRAYADAAPGTPEGRKTREAIEKKYGGHDNFWRQFDPFAQAAGKYAVPPLVAGGLAAGVPALAATMGAPWIAASMLPARMASGVSPAILEPSLAEIASTATGAAGAVGSAAKAAATNPIVLKALKLLGGGALGAMGFEGGRRLMH